LRGTCSRTIANTKTQRHLREHLIHLREHFVHFREHANILRISESLLKGAKTRSTSCKISDLSERLVGNMLHHLAYHNVGDIPLASPSARSCRRGQRQGARLARRGCSSGSQHTRVLLHEEHRIGLDVLQGEAVVQAPHIHAFRCMRSIEHRGQIGSTRVR
jgi:hypothetical protein